MLSMLQGVVQSGTGTRARACGKPCGGKTGTTNKAADVWWVGFTPDLSCAVWLGNEKPSRLHGASGGGWGAPVWAAFIKQAGEILQCDGQFPVGPGATELEHGEPGKRQGMQIEICAETGLRAGPNCPQRKTIWLKEGEQPPGPCTAHGGRTPAEEMATRDAPSVEASSGSVTREVCATTGLLATRNCPSRVPVTYREGTAPSGYCSLHRPGRSGNGDGGHSQPGPEADPGGGEDHGNGGSKPTAEPTPPAAPPEPAHPAAGVEEPGSVVEPPG
jgi:membrane peptidoglycan carboxypeptidase